MTPRTFVVKKQTPAIPIPKTEDRHLALWMQNVRERLDALENEDESTGSTTSTGTGTGGSTGGVVINETDVGDEQTPFYIPVDEEYLLAEYRQMVLGMDLEIDGILVADGFIVDMDEEETEEEGSPYPPLSIALDEVFYVPANTQVLFTEEIEVLGEIDIDGILVEVT